MQTNKADRSTRGFVQRLEHFRANAHTMGGPDGLHEISREIRAGNLVGTRDELRILNQLYAAIVQEMKNDVYRHEEVRSTHRFFFEQKRKLLRSAPTETSERLRRVF